MERASQSPKFEQFPRPAVALEDVKTPEDFLHAVDFKTLNEIFDEMATKAGRAKDIEQSDWISKEKVTIDFRPITKRGDVTEGGSYNSRKGITMLWNALVASEAPIYLAALHNLIHETAHSRSRYYEVYDETLPEAVVPVRSGKGLIEGWIPKDTEKLIPFAMSLDEAVTEEIALEVVAEYLRRTGNSNLIQGEGMQRITTMSYTGNRIMFQTIIGELGDRLGVDRILVWRSFIQMYLSGEESTVNLLHSIAGELSKEPMGNPLFVKGLLQSDPNVDLDETRQNVTDPASVQAAVERVFDRFGSSRVQNALGLP